MAQYPRPSPAAIKALKADPARAAQFDGRYGPGAAAVHLNGTVEMTDMLAELLEAQAETNAKLDQLSSLMTALIDQHKAPRRLVKDKDGEIIGVEINTDGKG